MNRRGFLGKMLVGLVALPLTVKVIGEPKPKVIAPRTRSIIPQAWDDHAMQMRTYAIGYRMSWEALEDERNSMKYFNRMCDDLGKSMAETIRIEGYRLNGWELP